MKPAIPVPITKPAIPVPILKNLRCGHCKRFVSCGPVHVTPNSGVLCGRCRQYAKEDYRNYAFEAVGSLFRYPCHYWSKHCNKRLMWNESLNHEGRCLFQSSCNVFCSRPGTFFKSDRKLPNTEINLQYVTDEVLQHLKCANCECYLSNAPVYILIEGKNLCHRCIHSNGIPQGSIQNLAYETIANGLIFPCIYRFRGCIHRGKFGRDMWAHESECDFGQFKKQQKKTSRVLKNGIEKERGVIQTHSGHIYATITQNSILGAYPQAGTSGGKVVTSELEVAINKKKQLEESFDVQSMDSVMSKSTVDSLGDNLSRSIADNVSRDNVSRTTIDNMSRSTADNISRDNISRDNVSRTSSRAKGDYRRSSNDTMLDDPKFLDYSGPYRQKNVPTYSGEVSPQPTPPGYIKSHNNHYEENMARYGPQFEPGFQYPTNQNYRPSLHYSPSFNKQTSSTQVQPKRSESFRVGNPSVIHELKELQKRQSVARKDDNLFKDCNNVQELVQKHDEVFQ